MQIHRAMLIVLGAAVASMAIPSPAAGNYTTVFGGPTWDVTTETGYAPATLPVVPGSTAGNGAAVGYARKYSSGVDLGSRAVRWDASGNAAAELGNLGTRADGSTNNYAYAVSSMGTAVGYAEKYTDGEWFGTRAVRWDASSNVAIELGNIGTTGGWTNSRASALNAAGTAVGFADKYAGDTYIGYRAVRWNASGSATELGNIGTDNNGVTVSNTYGVNSAGTAVGWAYRYVDGANRGLRAVRWDASGSAAFELPGNLGVGSDGTMDSLAFAVNSTGVTVGEGSKYVGGAALGWRAVRWDATGGGMVELGNLGTDARGDTQCDAFAVDSAGNAVGVAKKYTGGSYRGQRAVRWDALGTAALELETLGTDSNGYTNSFAFAMNSAGVAVGYASEFTDDAYLGQRAVVWNLDRVAIDLNTLIDPGSGWILTEAHGIGDTNWVTGIGSFNPGGGLPPYTRGFLMNVSSIAVPEPASLSLLIAAGVSMLRSRRLGSLSDMQPPAEPVVGPT